MDDSKNQAGNARLLNMPGRRDQMLRTMLLCALTAAIFFLPFYIIDGGFFHYAGDFNSQQISFYRYMNGFIKGAGYPDGMAGAARSTFSWATDLGSGAMNAYSFYLYGSPFFWLSLIFPQNWLPYLMVPLLVLKFAVAGGGAYRYLCRYVRRSDHAVLGACLYAFSGFSIYNVFFNHFIDVVALFPWMLWALDETLYEQEEHYGLFAFWVGVNLLNNYFFFIGQVLFLVIYFICKLTTKDFPMNVRLFVRLAFESLLGAALGFVLLWPAVLSILQNPRTIDLSSGWGFLTYSKVQQYLAILLSWLLPPDSPYITSIWSEGIIKWTSMSAYLPLCSLAGAMAYWRARKGDSKKRIVATCAIFALVPVLNSAFYALNSSYYARWYYMPVLILCAMTASALESPDISADELDAPVRGIGWLMVATLAFALVPVQDGDTKEWSLGVLQNPGQYAAVLSFGIGGLILYRLLCRRWRGSRAFARRMTAVVLAFACAFGMVHIGIGKFGQWHTDSDLVEQYTSAIKLKDDLPEGDWRVDTYKTHDNLGLWLDKSSLQYFGSTAAPSILSFYPALGVKRDVRSEPDISNYALRGLLSVKYLITTPEKQEDFLAAADDGWSYYDTKDGFMLYENENYVPMGFTYDYYITEESYETTVKNTRANLLMRALVLSEEDAEAYGEYLEKLPDAKLDDLWYDTYVSDCADRRASACSSFRMTNSGFHAEITLKKDDLVFFSVPYDDGFTAYVNGEETEVIRVDEGLMAVLAPAGENTIDFVYQADGYSLASKVSLAALAAFVLYAGYFVWKKKKHC
ncbi:MAG: YfhO family protein [Faecalibacterium prausnitzii]|nr:YfhO family protein [Faecalibacterium prausnitzii]